MLELQRELDEAMKLGLVAKQREDEISGLRSLLAKQGEQQTAAGRPAGRVATAAGRANGGAEPRAGRS